MKALVLNAEWSPRPGYPLSERERETGRAFVSSEVYRHPRLELARLADPSPAPDEVVIRVKACGVCGSDLHLAEEAPDGYVAYADHAKLPVVPGHEWSGVVAEVGPEVRSLRPGDRVCVEPMNWCGACDACRSGWPNQCRDLEEIGFSRDGGFAEYAAVKARYCWKIDALEDVYADADALFAAGALVEPCGVAYNALFVRSGGFLPGGNVLVVGAGPIGLTAIALARAAGAGRIVAFETVPERKALAASLGADPVLDPVTVAREGLDPAEVVLAATRGEGLAVAVEAAGASPRTYPTIERVMGPGGKIVQVGIGPGATPLSLVRLQQQGVSLYGSMGNAGSGIFPNVIRLMATGRIDLVPLVTARYPLGQAPQAFARTAERRDGKVMVCP
jgi:threonine dehydrogenase-like Zn-dependent dehydrogenase